MKHIVALSGGKDSSAMALRLAELGNEDYEFVCTPTGNELPEMLDHWTRLESLLGTSVKRLGDRTLQGLIVEQHAIPNWRMRWCTRKLKIEPFQTYILQSVPAVSYVGLRADEPGREGVQHWGDGVESRFPLVEWGWGISEVRSYLAARGVTVPPRTDCGLCFFQTIPEWYVLWKQHPERFAQGELLEGLTGHTFRSTQRDTWPAALTELRAEFEAGREPRPYTKNERPVMCSTCAR